MNDLISREDAIKAVAIAALDDRDELEALKAIPSAEGGDADMTVIPEGTGLMTPCPDNGADLISRADAIEAVKHSTAYMHEDLYEAIRSIPSAETTGALDDAISKYVADGYMLPPSGDLISRANAIAAVCKDCQWDCCDPCSHIRTMTALPSAEAVSREDYHNLLTATEDIDRALREYQAREEQASADAVQGEWGHMVADGTDGSHWYEYECSHCGEVVLRPYNYCPNCGAMMVREDGGE